MPLTASWIGKTVSQDEKEQYVRFRRKVVLPAQPASATVKISADSRYRLYINGKPIGFGPSRSYPHHQCVDVHEVTEAMQPGENLIAVLVYQPGYSYYSYACREKLGLWLTLEADGEPIAVSDDSWKTSRDPSFSDKARSISIYGAGQEVRDLRLAEPWIQPDFDEAGWEYAPVLGERIAGKPSKIPWAAMQIAPLENLVESVVQPPLIASDVGPYESNEDPHEVLRTAFLGSSIGSRERQLPEVQGDLPSVKQGDVLLRCYDVGHTQAGSACLHIRGAQGGEKILVSYFEKELEGQLILSDPTTYCQVRMTDSALLAPGDNCFEPVTPRGGRFLLLGLIGPIPKGLSIEVEFRTRRYPLALTEKIEPKDPLLQRIVEMCWRTMQACALDGMVDCPWREQASWVGDSAITSGVVAEMCGEPRLLKRMLELASQGAAEDGILPGIVTHESESTAVLTFNFAWVEGLSKYQTITEDNDFVVELWGTLSAMLGRFQQDLDSDGLLISQPDRRHFLDWAELSPNEPSCLYNLRYLYALQLAASLASRLGKPEDARLGESWARLLSSAIRAKFFQDGKWHDDAQASTRSQHIAAFLTLTGMIGVEEANQLLSEAVGCSLGEEDNELVLMSPYMHYYLFRALQQTGRSEDILDIIKHRWSIWLDQGAPTAWENWEVDFPDGSHCHAWSAHPLQFIAEFAEKKT